MFTQHPRISREECREQLFPLEQAIYRIVMDSSRVYREMYEATLDGAMALASSGRARCNLLYAIIAHFAKTRIPALRDIKAHIETKNGLVEVVFDAVNFILRLRFKKVDMRLRTSNYPTKQSRTIDVQKSLFGEPEETLRLVVGHRFDLTGSYVADVHIIYPFGRNPLWSYQATDGSDGLGITPMTTPLPSMPDVSVSSKKEKKERVTNAAGEA